MGRSVRIFIVDPEDRVFRFYTSAFSRLYGDPGSHPMLHFANMRLRTAEAVVALKNRRPTTLVRMVYFLLPFDDRGVLDVADLKRRQMVRLDSFAKEVGAGGDSPSQVLDGIARFTAQGGKWSPSPDLEAHLTAAAMGKTSCKRFCL